MIVIVLFDYDYFGYMITEIECYWFIELLLNYYGNCSRQLEVHQRNLAELN